MFSNTIAIDEDKVSLYNKLSFRISKKIKMMIKSLNFKYENSSFNYEKLQLV